jgi:hypothetical protein
MKILALAAVTAMFFGSVASPALATTYYIDTNNASANDSNAGTSDQPWKTISKANAALQPGDTVFIKAGDYTTASNTVYPSNSGTADKPITYKNYGSDVVNIKSTGDYGYGLRLDNRSYITTQGINFKNLDYFLYMRGGSHNTVAYCNFDNANLYGGATRTWNGSRISDNAQYNWIHNCRFSNYGYSDNDDHSDVLGIGTEESTDQTRYNLIENCEFYHGGHDVVAVSGMQNVLRNNYFHNEPWMMGTAASYQGVRLYGNRNIGFGGSPGYGGRNLFQNNRVGYCGPSADDWGVSGMGLTSSQNIVRSNCLYYNDVAGLQMSVTSSYEQSIVSNKIYSNTFFKNNNNPETDPMQGGIAIAVFSGSLTIHDNAFKNNLLYANRKAYAEYNYKTSDRKGLLQLQTWANNYDGDASDNPQFVNAPTTLGDPMNASLPDLRLQSTSPCKDYGTYLTTIVTDSGSGKSFQLQDAGYFMDGWGIDHVQGDMIQLFGTTQTALITSVDYTTNWISVDRPLIWTKGQGVSLPYSGSAPDAGAYEVPEPTSFSLCLPVFVVILAFFIRSRRL